MRLIILVGTILVSLGAVSCPLEPSRDFGNKPVTVAGSSTVYPITVAMVERYKHTTSKAQINVELSSTGDGFKRFVSGDIDIVDASRPIRQSELDRCGANNIRFLELPIGFDAIAVVVSQENTWLQSITTQELARIWGPESEGKILRWNQVNADWPDEFIHLYGPDRTSGTFAYFTKAILGQSDLGRQDYISSQDDKVLAEAIAEDPDALGYFGLSYYMANNDRLKALAIDDGNDDNGAGPQLPSVTYALDQTYQPLLRPLFIYVSEVALNRPEVVCFVEYYVTHAHEVVTETLGVSLSPETIATTEKRFQERIYGTAFRGQGSTIGLSMEDLLEMSIEELMEIKLK